MNNGLSNEDVNFIDNECKKELDKFSNNKYLQDNLDKIEKIPGSIKIKNIEKTNSLINNFIRLKLFNYLNIVINFRLMEPTIIYNVTHDGSINNSLFSGKSDNAIAGEYHIDGFRHDLKILIALEDINLLNGPTAILKKSNFKLNLFQNYFNIFYFKKYKKILGPTTKLLDYKLNKSEKFDEIVLKKGSCLFFDSRSLHYAVLLKSGIRKILWLYC